MAVRLGRSVGFAVIGILLGAITPAHAQAAADSQTIACPIPVVNQDPDTVTLTGPATIAPPDQRLVSYGITSSETPSEAGDGLPHGVTVSFSITTIDKPGGSSTTSPDAAPDSGNNAGDFSVTSTFQLKANLPASTRTYQIDWTASFDGAGGQSAHTCSSTDGTHSPFTITVGTMAAVVPETPLVAALPLAALAALGLALRRRTRSRTSGS